jgi:hypothetical protein
MALEALLGGAGGGAPAAGPAPTGGDPLMGGGGNLPAEIPDPEAPPGGGGGGGDPEVDALKTLITMGRDYTSLPSVDESERLEMEKCLTIFQKLLAGNEKSQAAGPGLGG